MTLSSDSIASPTGFERSSAPVGLARGALLWERVWVRLWPASGVLGLLFAAALAGVLEPLPWFGHAVVIAFAVTFAGLALERTFADFRLPDWDDGARRIERRSGLADRPLTEGNDRLAAGRGDGYAEALWCETLRRRLAAARNLRVGWPSPHLASRDPRALRYGVLLLVTAAAIAANTSWRERLGQAFLASENVNGVVAGLDAWIDPPAYTGQAPIYLSPAMREEVPVPAGARLNVRVHGADYAPLISISPSPHAGGEVKGRNGEYSTDALLMRSSSVIVRASGRTIGDWRLRVLPDAPPNIAFTGRITRTERLSVKIPFRASDDYGIASVRALLKPLKRKGATRSVEIPLPLQSAKTLKQTIYRDLTEDPYAGLDVAVTLEARDGAGQIARSSAMNTRLPMRIFTNPLARALVEQRQNLATDTATASRVLMVLDALTIAPELFYSDKKNIYTALRSAFNALKHAKGATDYQRVEDLLWQTALALEQGGLLNAAQELRRLQQLILQALAVGAPQEVIDALLQRYQQAMQRYMQLLAQNPQAQAAQPSPDAKTLSMEDLQTLLKIIQQMAASGNRDAAAQALALLQGLIENLRLTQGGGGGSPEDKALSDAIKNLDDLMGQQRNLLDKTYRQQQGNGDPQDGGPKGLAQKQGQLRGKLGEALKGLKGQKGAGNSLGRAEREMGTAQNQLGGNDTDSAVESEKNELEALRSSTAELSKQLMQRQGQGRPGGQGNEDPLGREQGTRGPNFGKGVKVPNQSEAERARNILQELRRRAAERGRPQEELDYIDRLLKQF